MAQATRIFDFVHARRQAITEAWQEAVATLPSAQRLSRPALIDHMPEFLDHLADWLRSDAPLDIDVFGRFAGEHALQRLGHGIELGVVTTEYRILRKTIWSLFTEVESNVDVHDVARLDEALDHAVGLAVDQYVRARDETRETFINVLAHDLRTPLGTVAAGADALLTAGNLDAKQSETVTRVARSSHRMERMIASLLELARARLGSGLPVHARRVDLGQIARNVVDETLAIHPSRTLRVITDGQLQGEWDPDLVAQAISNLVSNAVQHGADPIEIFVCESDPERVTVEVKNRGPVIAADVLPLVFEAYVRKAGQHANHPGLGLGLYIAAEIVRAHGGSIEARSSASEGTVFTMCWPRPRAQATIAG